MSPAFAFPDWAAQSDPPPPSPPPAVDPHRIGDLVNGFIAAKQDALFDAPDAFYRQSGGDAVAGADGVARRLADLRDATLGRAVDDGERQALKTQLDAQFDDALDGIDRHVSRERDVHRRQILTERQRLIGRAAELEHNNDAKLVGLADANAGTAQVLAHLEGLPDELAMQAARSAVWRRAIGQRLAAGQNTEAIGLFHRVNDQLTPKDQRDLDVPIQAARTDASADTWLAREQDKPGEPLPYRVQADPDLSPDEKAATLAKIEARESAKESARIATLQGLDDKLDVASDALATKPDRYKPGTLADLANAYEDAGEPAAAGKVRRLAQRESFLRAFAQSSVDAQQRQIDGLPDGEDRAAAEAIRDRQAEAFAKDPFATGTALYPDVGPPRPIDDLEGRVAQARTIAAYRGIPVVPFTAGELATMRRQLAGTPEERAAVLTRINGLPDDMKPALDDPSSSSPHAYGIDAAASMNALAAMRGENTTGNEAATGTGSAVPTPETPPGGPEPAAAERQDREADRPSWDDLSTLQQLGVAFQRLNEESKARGAALRFDSAARRVQQVDEFQRRKDAGEELKVTEARYLLRNRRATTDLAQAVGRLVEARRNLDRLPASDALRKFMEAQTPDEAARLLRERPGEIAKALGVESVPNLTFSLITSAVLGPIGGGLLLTGSSGLEGYANGLIGALDEEGVDVSDPEELADALQDKALMDRVRGKATTESAIQAGTTIASMLGGGGRKGPWKPKPAPPYSKGHHWVPGPIRRQPNLSAEARAVFNRDTSGWYGERHYNDGPHREYNQAVIELWNKNHYNPSKMTKRDAEDFLRQIRDSKDPRIADFHDDIVKKRSIYTRRFK